MGIAFAKKGTSSCRFKLARIRDGFRCKAVYA
jgi:hypothetical protein